MPLILLPIVAALVVKFFWLLAAVVGMVLAVRLIGVAGRMDDAALARHTASGSGRDRSGAGC